MTSSAVPAKIQLDKVGRKLVILWSDGFRHDYPWELLRENCPSAGERTARADDSKDPLALLGSIPSSEMADLRMVGNYAICPIWADGHDVGIFTWEYLRQLATDDGVSESAIA
ncbi:hypothetical protein Pan216_02930 [Planctomycetes bacterium Pan216]|uniref:Gamma-butyrobetaine hydroxylase-like N-terminal domain-containing protein n=1 Tax=Kolteria novifilia TaxID=2527975 RepID=A0A518AXL0_9BACT|nr:hypothetical protein Pan216_02930 [Planctomycetes bacterium Pan216]